MIDQNLFRSEMREDGILTVSYKDYKFDFDYFFIKDRIKVPKKDKNNKEVKWLDRKNLRAYLYDHYDTLCVYPTQSLVREEEIEKVFRLVESQDPGYEAFSKYYNTNRLSIFLILILYGLFGFIFGFYKDFDLVFPVFLIIGLIMIGVWTFYHFRKSPLSSYQYYSCRVFVYDTLFVYDDNEICCGVKVRVWDGEKFLIHQWYELGAKYKNIKHGDQVTMYVAKTGNKPIVYIKAED